MSPIRGLWDSLTLGEEGVGFGTYLFMNIIIVGAGEIGRHLAGSLSSAAHNIVVVERDPALAREVDNQMDARVVTGDGTSVNLLVECNVAECELFLALTSNNNANMVACSIAKELGAHKTICRTDPSIQREGWLFDYKDYFKIDHMFSSERLSALELAKFVRNPDSIMVEEIARGRVELQQVIVSPRSEVVGMTLVELKLPARIRIGAILRGDSAIVPTADEKIQEGDLVTLFGDPRKLTEVAERMQSGVVNDRMLNVVLLGGGDYGFSLAELLESWNCRVRIFEQDPATCERLTDQLAETTVINADATSLNELREEKVGEADFFIATTHNDEDNVMTCLQAHNLGTKHCLTLIHRIDYADAISQAGTQLGIAAAVSPREATRRELMRFVTSEKYHVVKKLRAGDVIEVTVPEGAKIAGKAIKDIDLPAGCVLVALMSKLQAMVPAADDVINAGDVVYAMVSPKVRKKFVKILTK
jgi:trk system potassium uptake protein TrkA